MPSAVTFCKAPVKARGLLGTLRTRTSARLPVSSWRMSTVDVSRQNRRRIQCPAFSSAERVMMYRSRSFVLIAADSSDRRPSSRSAYGRSLWTPIFPSHTGAYRRSSALPRHRRTGRERSGQGPSVLVKVTAPSNAPVSVPAANEANSGCRGHRDGHGGARPRGNGHGVGGEGQVDPGPSSRHVPRRGGSLTSRQAWPPSEVLRAASTRWSAVLEGPPVGSVSGLGTRGSPWL